MRSPRQTGGDRIKSNLDPLSEDVNKHGVTSKAAQTDRQRTKRKENEGKLQYVLWQFRVSNENLASESSRD